MVLQWGMNLTNGSDNLPVIVLRFGHKLCFLLLYAIKRRLKSFDFCFSIAEKEIMVFASFAEVSQSLF